MSNVVASFWDRASRGTKIITLGAVVLLLGSLCWGAFTVLHEDYGVLFADLSAGDAGAIVERLKQEKVPYRIVGNGTVITVPADRVHEVRLRLMTSDLPLSGGVGFEIFDKQGLGATEQTQRVSLQRALQGELARTIGALEQVKQVRVHLVLPESTLFTRDRQQASAAVNLSMRLGVQLTREEIAGIQRLVAAAVPGLEPRRVVITDQRGVTLSTGDAEEANAGAADARLQVKREIEEYITHKIARLLDSAFGPGHAIVSVDTELNFDATKTTVHDLLPAGGDSEGRLVRKRQVISGTANEPLWTTAAATDAAPVRQPSSSMEVEYEYGKRIAEVIAAPGAVTRMSIGVIVPGALSDEKRERISELVRMAAGINEGRGDAISVQALDQVGPVIEPRQSVEKVVEDSSVVRQEVPPPVYRITLEQVRLYAPVAVIAVLFFAWLVIFATRKRRLSDTDRQRILEEIQRALISRGRA
jgi:flagellar M-ring protein FliF